MATIRPDVDPGTIRPLSEQAVLLALRDQLPDDFLVVHSFPWLKPMSGSLREGEADFVIIHRRLGMLVLEVKGGDLLFESHQWFRLKAGGRERVKNPYEQARDNMHSLVEYVARRTPAPLLYGYAVVFPDHVADGTWPADAEASATMLNADMPNLGARVVAAMEAWARRRRQLTDAEFQQVVDALLPRLRLRRPLGPWAIQASARLLEVTAGQVRALDAPWARERVLVEGPAGSGKTFIAIERALRAAGDGSEVLFVCFNGALAAWLREQLAQDVGRSGAAKRISVHHFHALARNIALQGGVPFVVPEEPAARARFWAEEASGRLEQAMDFVGMRFDVIVVDEAQDLRTEWWYAILGLRRSEQESPVWVFRDDHQALFGTPPQIPLEFERHESLEENCRNTRAIAAGASSIGGTSAPARFGAPDGRTIEVIEASGLNHRSLATEIVERLLREDGLQPGQIVLIGPRALANGSLKGARELSGVPLTDDAREWRLGGRILVTTARKFKGLEADVVVLYDLGGLSVGEGAFTRADLYVAMTRARAHLIAVSHDRSTLEVLRGAQRVSEEAEVYEVMAAAEAPGRRAETSEAVLLDRVPYPLAALHRLSRSRHEASARLFMSLRYAEGVARFSALVTLAQSATSGANAAEARRWLGLAGDGTFASARALLEEATEFLVRNRLVPLLGPEAAEPRRRLIQAFRELEAVCVQFGGERPRVPEQVADAALAAMEPHLSLVRAHATTFEALQLGYFDGTTSNGDGVHSHFYRARGAVEVDAPVRVQLRVAPPHRVALLVDTRDGRALPLAPFVLFTTQQDEPTDTLMWLARRSDARRGEWEYHRPVGARRLTQKLAGVARGQSVLIEEYVGRLSQWLGLHPLVAVGDLPRLSA
ncbi:MAG: hypothetical protein JWM10_719 [Myxococcaceae bacterium]|nr:hypothetical protein [Myxococcaceae bacterium]